MLKKVTLLWILGLITLVPYGVYYLFFQAQRDEYALVITAVLFWIFGFWGVAGPILSAIRIRRVFKALEQMQSKEELQRLVKRSDTEDAAIDLVASENHIPRFLAKRIYKEMVKRLSDRN